MPVAYKNAGKAVTTAYTTVYTCPAATEAIISHIQVSNIDGAAAVTGIGVRWEDNSAATYFVLLQDASIPVGGAVSVLGEGGVLHLEAADSIEVIADNNSDAEITVTLMEVT